MKRALITVILILGVTVANGFAQMGQGHMSGQGMMGGSGSSDENEYNRSQHPMMGAGMMGYGGYGMGSGGCNMMGPGMMGGGYGMGPGMMGRGHMGGMMGGGYGMGPGMMGQGQMGGMMGQGHMGGMMGQGGSGSSGYSPEEYKKYQDEYNKYLNDTADIRKKLHNKKFEYFETIRKPDAKREAILKIEKEMRDLQWEIYEKSPQ